MASLCDYKIKKAASAEVAAFLFEGYRVLLNCETCIVLKHTRNGNTIRLYLEPNKCTVTKNGRQIKSISN